MNLYNEKRGFRNNNPGNIRHGDPWLGLAKKQTDSDFCQFMSVEYGIRAIFKILDTYKRKHNIKTIENTIYRWAPSNENDSRSYIKSICKTLEKNIDQTFIPKSIIHDHIVPYVVMGIIKYENGIQPFSYDFLCNCEKIG